MLGYQSVPVSLILVALVRPLSAAFQLILHVELVADQMVVDWRRLKRHNKKEVQLHWLGKNKVTVKNWGNRWQSPEAQHQGNENSL